MITITINRSPKTVACFSRDNYIRLTITISFNSWCMYGGGRGGPVVFCNNNNRANSVKFAAAWDPKRLSSENLFKVLYMIQIASLVEEETQVRGAVILIDFHGLSTKQVMALSPSFAMTLLLYIQVSAKLI